MSDKDLESFKIGSTHQPGISSPVSSHKNEPSSPAEGSLGFPRIEKLLENEDPGDLSVKLNKLINDLEAFHENADSNQDKLAANKAMGAIERVADLMNYLFQTKANLETPNE